VVVATVVVGFEVRGAEEDSGFAPVDVFCSGTPFTGSDLLASGSLEAGAVGAGCVGAADGFAFSDGVGAPALSDELAPEFVEVSEMSGVAGGPFSAAMVFATCGGGTDWASRCCTKPRTNSHFQAPSPTTIARSSKANHFPRPPSSAGSSKR